MTNEEIVKFMVQGFWSKKCTNPDHSNHDIMYIACPECCPDPEERVFHELMFVVTMGKRSMLKAIAGAITEYFKQFDAAAEAGYTTLATFESTPGRLGELIGEFMQDLAQDIQEDGEGKKGLH